MGGFHNKIADFVLADQSLRLIRLAFILDLYSYTFYSIFLKTVNLMETQSGIIMFSNFIFRSNLLSSNFHEETI